jgi:hypothetical protein
MGIVVATTVGLVMWIVWWALGGKAFDAFMITAAIAVVATAARVVTPLLNRDSE